jgi:peptidoglycan hydrolase-like protein with peptidoglycan-binding domain
VSGEPELRPGISDEWVQWLQELMADAGYWTGPPDGQFSDELAEAVRGMQQEHGLTDDAVVREDTWQVLTEAAQRASLATQAQAARPVTAEQPAETAETAQAQQQGQVPVSGGGEPELSPGISGEWVLYLEQLLAYYGFWNGPQDGHFTEELAGAVRIYQQTYGLTVTGAVGQETWVALTGTGATPAAAAWTPCTMPGPREGLNILPQLDNICGRMKAAGFNARIGSGRRTVDEQVKTYAKGRTFREFKADIEAAAAKGSVATDKAAQWVAFFDPAHGGHSMPPGEPGPVTWTFTSHHLTGAAADVVDEKLGWQASPEFWAALKAAAEAEGLQIGPPATDVAHVQRP